MRTPVLALSLALVAFTQAWADPTDELPPRLVVVTPRAWEGELEGYLAHRRQSLPVEVALHAGHGSSEN
jgi:hypothetical protein